MAPLRRNILQHTCGIVSLCFAVSLLAGCSRTSPSLGFIASSLALEQTETGQAFENSIGLIFVPIPSGEFQMGTSSETKVKWSNIKDESPLHRVRISTPFFMSVSEVTQKQYTMVMDEKPWLDEPLTKKIPSTPATYVSHKKATDFCKRLSKREDKVYRLPTEAEWEYACRSGTLTAFHFGNKPFKLGEYAWYFNNAYKANEQYPHPWGLKKPNHWMLYDMHGNVCEWCSDKYDLYPTTLIKKVTIDPKGPEKGRLHVWRGGGFSSNSQDVRSATRHIAGGSHYRPEYLAGFRVVCEMKEQNIKSSD